jgi:hypothetical protein
MDSTVIIGGLAFLVIAGVLVWLFSRRQPPNITGKPDGEKPAWMRSTPPKETTEALKASGQKAALYGHEKGEALASPFAEQIEDMVRAKLDADPFLKSTRIDFGTAPDGGIEFVINNQSFTSLEQIPEGRIKAIIKQAIESYNQQK